MPLGPAVRRLFGRHEHRVAALYRAIFVDIDAYARQIGDWVPAARRILEVGCGEGAVTERLVRLYPEADILAIDITPRVGRLFRGPHDRVTFRQVTVQQVAADAPGAFDLVILSDVLHHVPGAMRGELLAAVRATVASGGALIFKDWERTAAPIHWLCHAGDRWLTGDRVRYLRRPEAEAMLADAFGRPAVVAQADAFGRPAVVAQAFVKPWRNNFAMLARA